MTIYHLACTHARNTLRARVNNSTANGPIREIPNTTALSTAVKTLYGFPSKNFNDTQPKSTMSNLIMPVIHKQKKGTFMQDRYMHARSKKILDFKFQLN